MLTKQMCFCGGDRFWLFTEPSLSNRITLVCHACHCRRRITTPGRTALNYELRPAVCQATVSESDPTTGSLEAGE